MQEAALKLSLSQSLSQSLPQTKEAGADAFSQAAPPFTATFQSLPDSYETQLYNYKSGKGRSFLKDKVASVNTLPALLPKGLPYAANFVSFESLRERGVLNLDPNDGVSITTEELRLLYQAKCLDQGLPLSWEREVRFMELVSANCRGTFFSLPENGFGPASAEAVSHVLSANRFYSILDLSGNQLRDAGAISIAALIRTNRTLVHIGLSSNDIGHVGGVAIAEALKENNTVVSLDLGARSGANGNHIGLQGAEAIGNLLKRNPILSRLTLSSNGLGSAGLSHIVAGLNVNHTLTHLELCSNNLGKDGAVALATVLGGGRLKSLAINRNNFGDKGGAILFEAIATAIENSIDGLEFLDTEHNGFEEETAKAIAKVLSGSTTLKTLRLSGNRFIGASKYIAEGLLDNKHLLTLSLGDCGIRETEGSAFCTALTTNKTLLCLDLSRNKLKDMGAQGIAKGLGANRGLTSLNLSTNKIRDEGGKALANALLSNSSISSLNLRRNAMSSTTGDLFNENLRTNSTVKAMDVSYNDFSYKCFMGIKASLTRNANSSKQLIIPKLTNEIETLASKERELSQVEEEIEMEKRIIKDRSEQLVRRNEEVRIVNEKMRRDIVDLEKVLDKVRTSCESTEDLFRKTEDRVANEISTLRSKRGNMDTRIQQEKDRIDRMHRDMDRMRRQIKQIQDAESERLAPLVNEIEESEADRAREMHDAKFEAEKLASLALRKTELEIALKIKL